MSKFNVIACQTINGKDGKQYFRPSVILDNGAVHTFFSNHPYKQGDSIETRSVQQIINGRMYLVEVIKE